MRTMYDGIDALATGIAGEFPAAELVAGYVDGLYAWSLAEWALFPPPAEHVTIAVSASVNAGDVLDVETGDAAPDQTHDWIAMRRAAGLWRPTIYCNMSTVPAVRQGTGSLVLGRDYDLWVADYDGSTTDVYPLAVAKQYRTTGSYDVSAVYDDAWPHRTPLASAAPAAIVAPVWPAGTVLREGGTGAAVTVLQTALRDSGLRGVRGITVDGTFGPQTLTALRNFQEAMHLAVDGVAGPATRAALGVH